MAQTHYRVCITGSSGFVGSNLCRYLEESPAANVSVFRWDKEDPGNFGNCDVIIHCAARVHQMHDRAANPLQEFLKVNHQLTVDLARKAIEQNVKKFIFLSTVKVFGEKPGSYDDHSPMSPDDPYSLSKVEAENSLARLFEEQKGLRCIIFRLPMVYGPDNKGNILSLLRMAAKKLPLPLGGVTNKRSMVFIDNICSAVHQAISKDPDSGIVSKYILTDNSDLSSRELYKYLYELINQSGSATFYVPYFLLRPAALIGSVIKAALHINLPLTDATLTRLFNEYKFSPEKFCHDYDWQPPFGVKDGLKRTVDWYLTTGAERK